MDFSLFKKLAAPLAVAVGKGFKAARLKSLMVSKTGDHCFATLSFTPLVGTPSLPSETQLRSNIASANLPGSFEIDNLELVASPVKSFHYTARKVVTVSLYLVSDEDGLHVAEFTILPFAGTMHVEIFPQ